MGERGLSVLSLRKLRQMLKAITFDEGVKEKSKARVEEKNVAVDEDAKIEKAKMQEEEKIEDKTKLQLVTMSTSVEAKRSESLSTKQAATEKKAVEELAANEKQLKLQNFSAEERIKEDFGDNQRKKMKAETFQVKDVPTIPRNIRQVYVAEKSNKEMKEGWDAGTGRPQQLRHHKRRRDRWKAELNPVHAVTLQDIMEVTLFSHGRNWSSLASEKEKGFRFIKTQNSTIGLESFLAQSYYYPQLMQVTKSNRVIVSAITTSENPNKSLLPATYSKPATFLPLFGVDASKRKEPLTSSATSKLLREFSHWWDAERTTQGEVGVILDLMGLFGPSNRGRDQQTRLPRLWFIAKGVEEELWSTNLEILWPTATNIARSSEFTVALCNERVHG